MSTNRLVAVDDLVTIDEIAKRLRMSLNATHNVVMGRDGRAKLKFPKPLVGVPRRGVWLWQDVEEWWNAVAPKTVEGRKRAAQAAAMTYKREQWRKSA